MQRPARRPLVDPNRADSPVGERFAPPPANIYFQYSAELQRSFSDPNETVPMRLGTYTLSVAAEGMGWATEPAVAVQRLSESSGQWAARSYVGGERGRDTLTRVEDASRAVADASGAFVLMCGIAAPAAAAAPEAAVVAETAPFGGLSRAAEFGLRPYNQLRQALRGTDLQAHHLIEQRFAAVMGQNARQMTSVAVTRAEHQQFTNAWRAAIPYGPNGTGAATSESVIAAARQIYADYPAILSALGL